LKKVRTYYEQNPEDFVPIESRPVYPVGSYAFLRGPPVFDGKKWGQERLIGLPAPLTIIISFWVTVA